MSISDLSNRQLIQELIVRFNIDENSLRNVKSSMSDLKQEMGDLSDIFEGLGGKKGLDQMLGFAGNVASIFGISTAALGIFQLLRAGYQEIINYRQHITATRAIDFDINRSAMWDWQFEREAWENLGYTQEESRPLRGLYSRSALASSDNEADKNRLLGLMELSRQFQIGEQNLIERAGSMRQIIGMSSKDAVDSIKEILATSDELRKELGDRFGMTAEQYLGHIQGITSALYRFNITQEDVMTRMASFQRMGYSPDEAAQMAQGSLMAPYNASFGMRLYMAQRATGQSGLGALAAFDLMDANERTQSTYRILASWLEGRSPEEQYGLIEILAPMLGLDPMQAKRLLMDVEGGQVRGLRSIDDVMEMLLAEEEESPVTDVISEDRVRHGREVVESQITPAKVLRYGLTRAATTFNDPWGLGSTDKPGSLNIIRSLLEGNFSYRYSSRDLERWARTLSPYALDMNYEDMFTERTMGRIRESVDSFRELYEQDPSRAIERLNELYLHGQDSGASMYERMGAAVFSSQMGLVWDGKSYVHSESVDMEKIEEKTISQESNKRLTEISNHTKEMENILREISDRGGESLISISAGKRPVDPILKILGLYDGSGDIGSGMLISNHFPMAGTIESGVNPREIAYPDIIGDHRESSFFNKMRPYAMRVEKETGIPASVTLAQWALESGFESSSWVGHNNYSGIRRNGRFEQYDTIDDFVDDHIRVLNLSYYDKVRQAALEGRSPEEIALLLGESPWDEGHYLKDGVAGKKLLDLMRGWGLSGGGTLPSADSASDFVLSQGTQYTKDSHGVPTINLNWQVGANEEAVREAFDRAKEEAVTKLKNEAWDSGYISSNYLPISQI